MTKFLSTELDWRRVLALTVCGIITLIAGFWLGYKANGDVTEKVLRGMSAPREVLHAVPPTRIA